MSCQCITAPVTCTGECRICVNPQWQRDLYPDGNPRWKGEAMQNPTQHGRAVEADDRQKGRRENADNAGVCEDDEMSSSREEEGRIGHRVRSKRLPGLHRTPETCTAGTQTSKPYPQCSKPSHTTGHPQHTNVQAQKKLAVLTRTATVVARCQSWAAEHPPCRGARIRERAVTQSLGARCDSSERSVRAKMPWPVR